MPHTSAKATAGILVIDDESSMGEFMKIMLAKEGYDVCVHTSAVAALDVLQKAQRSTDCARSATSRNP